MTLPQILADLMKLLFDLAVPAAICTLVLAGLCGAVGGCPPWRGTHVLPILGVKVCDTNNSVLLTGLSRKSSALRPGLRKRDVITAVDGEPVARILELAGELANREAEELIVVRAQGSPEGMTLVCRDAEHEPLVPAITAVPQTNQPDLGLSP